MEFHETWYIRSTFSPDEFGSIIKVTKHHLIRLISLIKYAN